MGHAGSWGGSRLSIYSTNGVHQANNYYHHQLNYSWGMSLNSAGNKLAVASYNNNMVAEFNVSGQSLSFNQVVGSGYSTSNGYFRYPVDTGYDSSGNIYALDLNNHRIQKFNSSLTYQAKTGSWSISSGFRYPYGMHIDSSDNIYVTDYYNFAVRKYDTKTA